MLFFRKQLDKTIKADIKQITHISKDDLILFKKPIPAGSHTFVEIDHEIISTAILLPSRRVVVSYKRKYVHKLLVNRLFKPAQEKVWLGELTVLQ